MWHHFNYERAAEMRSKYIPIEKVLSILDLTATDVIMDVGGGDGFYSNLFSEKCSKVYYVDASNSAVDMVKDKLSGKKGKVEIIQDDICTMKLPKELTKVFFSNSFHDLGCRETLIDRIVGNSSGTVKFILIEFKKDATIGPPESVKIHPDELDSLFKRHGYVLERREFLAEHYVSSYGR